MAIFVSVMAMSIIEAKSHTKKNVKNDHQSSNNLFLKTLFVQKRQNVTFCIFDGFVYHKTQVRRKRWM